MIAREQMLELMAYADGELDGAARSAVEARLASDPEAARFVAELGGLGGLVREGFEVSAEADRVAAFDVADVVMARVANEASTTSASVDAARGSVRSLESARARRRAPVVPVMVGLLAVAAAGFLVLRKPAATPMAGIPQPAKNEAVAVNEPRADGPGVEVEAVESSGSAVSVFYLPGASELSTSVVVWVDETGEK